MNTPHHTLGCGRTITGESLLNAQGDVSEDLLQRHLLTCKSCAWFAEQLKPIIARLVSPDVVSVEMGAPVLPQPIHEWSKDDIVRLRRKYGYSADSATYPKTMAAWARLVGIHRQTIYAWEAGRTFPRRVWKLRLDQLLRELEEETNGSE